MSRENPAPGNPQLCTVTEAGRLNGPRFAVERPDGHPDHHLSQRYWYSTAT